MTIEDFGVACIAFCWVAGGYAFGRAMGAHWPRRRRKVEGGHEMWPRDISVLREGENAE
jgi:hypothetical protein